MQHKIKNLSKAVSRVKKAIKKQEAITLFGDGDLDGATAVSIVQEAIATYGGKVDKVYFPDREKEGYGLNEKSLAFIKQYAPGLLIVLDSGVSSHNALKQAKALGFDSVVIDHHEVLGEVPKYGLIIDPKQPKDNYPFKKLSASSLAYLFAKELLGKQISPAFLQGLKELAALGAIADMMPEEDVNQEVISAGLETICDSFRLGFGALKQVCWKQEDSPRVFFSKMVGILNITETRAGLTDTYLLLNSSDKDKALELSKNLLVESEQRRLEIKNIADVIAGEDQSSPSKIVFDGSPGYQQYLTGAIASRVCNKTQKPIFIYKLGEEESRGSVRMPKGIDAVKVLQKCEGLLLMFGGHPPAAGFHLKNENIEKFKDCLEKQFT